MPTADVFLALLRAGRGHGYDLKRGHDTWFPDARPLAFGQVYSTLGRLDRDGLVEVVETVTGRGPERTVYTLTSQGEARLAAWLGEPERLSDRGSDEIVRKTVSALRTGGDARGIVLRQRTAHLRRMSELSGAAALDPIARLAREHMLAHLNADLRWLDVVEQAEATADAEPPAQPSLGSGSRSMG